MATARMKLVLLWLCTLHVVLASARLFTRNDLQAAHRSLSESRAQNAQSTAGSFRQGRLRPLFARRGQYERQSVPKSRVVPALQSRPRPRLRPPPPPIPAPYVPTPVLPQVTPTPVKITCSHLTQSCLPQSGCCEPHTTCHCRFFNAICFCRRTN